MPAASKSMSEASKAFYGRQCQQLVKACQQLVKHSMVANLRPTGTAQLPEAQIGNKISNFRCENI
jgi:hypothetical protein